MIKAWLATIWALVILGVAYWVDLFDFFAGTAMQYIAVGGVILAFVAARIILGSPLKRDKKDEKNGD